MSHPRPLSLGLAALLTSAALLVAGPASAAVRHEGGPACSTALTVNVDAASWQGKCTAPFQGFPVGAAGVLYMDDKDKAPRMDLDAEIGVDVWLLMANGTRKQYKPMNCSDAEPGIARCFGEKNFVSDEVDLGEGTVPEEIVGIECDAESRTLPPIGTKPTAQIACWSTSAGREDLEAERWFSNYGFPPYEPPPPSTGGIDPFRSLSDAGVKSQILAVPVDTYATDTVVVHRRLGANYTNLDSNFHDVVARDDFRPDGSAPWCANFKSGKCPLFWTPLIGNQKSAPVLGLQDAEPGKDYTFYCSIHPLMVGTIKVVQ